jgi:Homeodomain-like domain
MEHTTDAPPLTTIQQCVVNALTAGATLSDAAEAHGVHRVTVYRWMKTRQEFSVALHRARAEFVLARRDDLHDLSNRALETLLAILNNPHASPAVLFRTAAFILQRPQMPKTGWSMPEPAPDPDGEKLLDSGIIERDYDGLPGLCTIEREIETDDPVPVEPEIPAGSEAPAGSAAFEPWPSPESPVPAPSDVAGCNGMQHDSEDFVAAPAPRPGLRSCPVPRRSSKPASSTKHTLSFRI